MTRERHRELDKLITKDWLERFPEFGKFGPKKFLKVVGPVMFGIWLDLPTSSYYVQVYIEGLWTDMPHPVSKSLAGIYNQRIFGRKNYLSVEKEWHSNHIEESAYYARKYYEDLNISGDIKIDDFLKKFDIIRGHTIWMGDTIKRPLTHFLDLVGYSNLFKIMLYGDPQRAEKILDEAKSIVWDPNTFNPEWPAEKFISEMEYLLANRDKFLEDIHNNMQKPKIKKLPRSEMIY